MADITKIKWSGDSASRIDIIVLSEGYRISERERFLNDANEVEKYLLSDSQARLNSPFSRYASLINYSAVFVPSAQSGYSTPSSQMSTAFGAQSYLADGRLIYGDEGKVYAALNFLPDFSQKDVVLVLINSSNYGGAGGSVAWATARNPYSLEVALHEIGHSFAGLQDEYVDPALVQSHPLRWISDSKHLALTPNTTLVPWSEWIGYTDSLGTVGVYEGGYYRSSGVWRATATSKMLTNGVAFNAPEKEAFIEQFYLRTDDLITALPQQDLVHLAVTTPDDSLFRFDWSINGAHQVTERSTLDLLPFLTKADDGAIQITASVTVSDGTGMVRDQSVLNTSSETETFSLAVQKATIHEAETQMRAQVADNHFVIGSSGNDSIRLLSSGSNMSWVEAGQGNDNVEGSEGRDLFKGGEGSDRLVGAGGNDLLIGGGGSDVIEGGSGSDELWGADMIMGQPSSLLTSSTDDRDVLRGGPGDDVIYGEDGGDLLSGGSGADIFAYRTEASSLAGYGRRDVINDFEVGHDKIDLRDLFSGSLQLVAKFSGVAGQISIASYHHDYAMVRIDIDGNLKTDMQINVFTAGAALTAQDFLL